MKKFTTISFVNNNNIVQKGIILLEDPDHYFVYSSPGEITIWSSLVTRKPGLFDSFINKRFRCPKIPEFEECLRNTLRSNKSVKCAVNWSQFYNTYNLVTYIFNSVNYKDKSGLNLYGICLHFILHIGDKEIYLIYDGSRLSVWEKSSNIMKEVKNFFISNNSELDKLIDSSKTIMVDKIEYLPLSKKDQKRVKKLIDIRNKNVLDKRIKDLGKFLKKDKFLDDLVNLTKSVGNAYPHLIRSLLDLYKL